MKQLQGKTALVTGASRGIGRAIALELARQGISRLLLVARNETQLVALADEIQSFGVEAISLPVDLTQSTSINKTIAQSWQQYGPIDLLINCAGVAYQAPFLQIKLPKVYEEISLNLMGMVTVTSLLARRMAHRGQGTIVNVSSLMGKIAAPTFSTYSATKFAILGFTQALRRELASHNVNVVALLPSLTDTDMVREQQRFKWVRLMTPEQVAQALIIGLRRGDREIIVGWQSRLALWCQRFAPWLLDRIIMLASPLSAPKQKQKLLWKRRWKEAAT